MTHYTPRAVLGNTFLLHQVDENDLEVGDKRVRQPQLRFIRRIIDFMNIILYSLFEHGFDHLLQDLPALLLQSPDDEKNQLN